MAKFCTYCGKEIDENDNVCGYCGNAINKNNATVINVVNNTNKTDGFATAGFVLSLVSFLCCGSTSVIALIFSIVGLVNCSKNGTNGKGLAISGIVISTVLVFILVVLYIITSVLGYATALY